jgi:hypothetical protein
VPLSISSGRDALDGLSGWATAPGFSALDAHPYWGRFGRTYYPLAESGSRRDESFAVLEDGRPALLVPCSLGMGTLDWYGLPMRLFPREGVSPDVLTSALDRALEHLDTVAGHAGAKVVIGDPSSQPVLSALGQRCMVRAAAASVWLTGVVDLADGERGMRRGLRKSFKSLLNWGRQNLETRILGFADPDRALFDSFQAFHGTIAGRTTRPQASWDFMFDWMAAGHGELIVSFLDKEMIGGTMIVDGGSTAGYASGVYDRSRFDKPLAHWPLWLAMVRSAERGMKAFDLGGLPLPPEASDKERSIAYFKRGFATSIDVQLYWTWSPAENPRGEAR